MSDSSIIADGSIFADRYQVVRCIARGGMGAIYEVIHLETQRRRALKVILPHVLQSSDLRERFRQEARIAASVDSEHIVDVFDAGVDEARQMPFLVMELLKGEDLAVRLERLGKFAPEDVVVYLRQTAMALDKTHAANIVHRDLKPENLYLTQRDDGQPRIKVLDFGVAKVLADGATRSHATRSIGTPLYMPPEQFTAGARVSPATDIYALGMIAYTLLVGSAYFTEEAEQAGNMFAFAAAIGAGPKELPTVRAQRHGVTLPPAFDTWFTAVTNSDPKQRPRPASVVVDQLADALRDAGAQRSAAPFAATIPAPYDRAASKSPAAVPSQTPATIVSPTLLSADRESLDTGEVPSEPRSASSRWAWIGAIVLAAVVSVITWMVLQETPNPERNATAASAASAPWPPAPEPRASAIAAQEKPIEVRPNVEPSATASTQPSSLPANTVPTPSVPSPQPTNASPTPPTPPPTSPANTGTSEPSPPPTPPTPTATSAPTSPPTSTSKKIDPSLKVWK